MDDATKQELTRFLTTINGAMESGVDLAWEQAPLIAQEIVLYGRITNTLGSVVMLLISSFFLIVVLAFNRKYWNTDVPEKDADYVIWGTLFCIGAAILSSAILVIEFLPATAMAWFAPRLYVVMYVADLLK